jgi:nucleoside diphosphate kinase
LLSWETALLALGAALAVGGGIAAYKYWQHQQPQEITLALIKPDAVKGGHAAEIEAQAHAHGFAIVGRRKYTMTKEQVLTLVHLLCNLIAVTHSVDCMLAKPFRPARKACLQLPASSMTRLHGAQAGEFYAEHKGRPFFSKLCEFMSSGPLVALALRKVDAIAAWRKLAGVHDARFCPCLFNDGVMMHFVTCLMTGSIPRLVPWVQGVFTKAALTCVNPMSHEHPRNAMLSFIAHRS